MTAPSPRKQHALELFEELPARYDELGAALSFFQDPRWRRAMVEAVEAGPEERVLDVATGTGLVAGRWSSATAAGWSASTRARRCWLGRGRSWPPTRRWPSGSSWSKAKRRALPFADGEFDHLTFTYLLRYVDDPAATLRELARVVKPGGRIACLEFCVPRRDLALALAPLHPDRAAGAGPAGLAPVVRGRPLPRPEHRRLLPALSARAPAGAVARRPGSARHARAA